MLNGSVPISRLVVEARAFFAGATAYETRPQPEPSGERAPAQPPKVTSMMLVQALLGPSSQ